jgi:glycosyltransferase involved in cell wall biosynthesis
MNSAASKVKVLSRSKLDDRAWRRVADRAELPRDLLVSVVIPVRGRPADLACCLSFLFDQSLSPDSFEILVCDDGSSPEDAARIQALCEREPSVRYLRQAAKGPAAARNLGVQHAQAPVIAFTDSDTLPSPAWLESLLVRFEDPNVVAVEGPVRAPCPAESPLQEAPRSEGGVFLTANMAYRRWAIVAVGGLDESFPLPAFEDVDLALCVAELGCFEFAENAVVVHPWRKITWKDSIRRWKNFDWLLVSALRHGCLGWKERPTSHPRLRVATAAALTLPLGRLRRGLTFLTRAPKDSMLRIGLSLVELAVGMALSPRFLCRSYDPARRRYLGESPA